MVYNQKHIDLLKLGVIKKFGRSIETHKDSKELAVFVKVDNAPVSAQTIRRIFGLIKNEHKPSIPILNALASYVGYENFNHFLSENLESQLEFLFSENVNTQDYWDACEKLSYALLDSPEMVAICQEKLTKLPIAREYFIENDWLDCIVQLPNNLFYNTGITTYIWFLNNNKPAERKGKVILIDASQRYAKLRKNLGNKNCELAPEHIQEIQEAYLNFATIERKNEEEIAAKIFKNSDFGYYKVNIERPARLKAQLSAEKVESLRYEKTLAEPMQWAYETYGEKVYTELKNIERELLDWCEKNDIDLTNKKKKQLIAPATWSKQKKILDTASLLWQKIGDAVYSDFNLFKSEVEKTLKKENIKLSAAEKNQIYNAVSWYDETAEKVIAKKQKLEGDKLEQLLDYLGCTKEDLPDYGYYPTQKKGEYITYESQTDLRDSETIPLNQEIHDYFLREVKPYVEEAWIDLSKTKIGYEISFNKYFYQHKALRSIEEVNQDILALEQESDGLIAEILNI
ncbi:N-6 DNA methylase [Ornithobacterium rhinotracheale]|uniref:N-6 DNA methylase n=1 Tax=Ornithobacterium rhinotracheale TaxID=28251 RepID=UPI001FF3B251|nr:N-6 DNA methylase [Ornithobacterium rhinotracheale]MCK0206391.1 SAM-dependent methyltransferase [Ornithobacterium rhinotracheale]